MNRHMTRKGAVLAGVLALAVVGVASIAFARGHPGVSGEPEKVKNPHGRYTSDTNYCGSCHGNHDAAGEALPALRTEKAVCLSCHGEGTTASDVLTEYKEGEGGTSKGSMGHRVLPEPDDEGLDCADCHTPHQDPAENPSLLRVQVLNPENDHKVWLYNGNDEPVGNDFCYACHGVVDPVGHGEEPVPAMARTPLRDDFGDFTAFEGSAHNQLSKMDEAIDPDGEEVPSKPAQRTPEQRKAEHEDDVTGKIVCLYCHAPHDSDYRGLTTDDQELLCYRCHSRAEPNTDEDTSPYRAFNVAENIYGTDGDPVRIYHHPIAEDEQQSGKRQVECVSCHNPHFDAATDLGTNAKIANPERTTSAWPTYATKRGAGRSSAEPEKTGPVTYGRWARALLKELVAPNCRDNLILLVAWQTQEGTSATWNPLATTYRMTGTDAINDAGVRNYLSMAQGLDATRLTLEGGWSSNGYGLIVKRLQACAKATETVEAITDSDWCPGCSDRYVGGLVARVDEDYRTFADTLVSGSGPSFSETEIVNGFCIKCHEEPEQVEPVTSGDRVPYSVRLVNDRALDPGGQPHDLFVAEQYEESLHAGTACTACHDVHGSSNAYALREIVTAPDGSRERAMFNFNGMDQPDDREKYGSFCLSCHKATAEPHVDRMVEAGTYCRECHYHGSEQF